MVWSIFESNKQKKARMRESILNDLKKEQGQLAADTIDMQGSDEPWVTIKGMVNDPIDGVKIELDWNDAFIAYLKTNGINGADDDTIIQKYITLMMQDVAESMSSETSSDYE